MRAKIRGFISLCIVASLVLALVGCGDSASTKEVGSVEHEVSVMAADLSDTTSAAYIMSKINVGWNLGNSLDSKIYDETYGADLHLNQETAWGNPKVTKELIDAVKAAGFNTIRIPVTWYYNSSFDANGNLVVGQQWLARVSEVVNYAIQNDMYVILNSHHDGKWFHTGVKDAELQVIINEATCLWTQVATYFKYYDERLIFEGFNEVDNYENEKYWQFGKLAAKQMNMLNQAFVNSVRNAGGKNATRTLICPTLLHGNGEKFLNAFELPTDTVEGHLIIAVHCYNKSIGQDIEPIFERIEALSNKTGAPVIITEMGSNTKYPVLAYRGIHAANYVSRAYNHGIKCVWWDNGTDYAIISRQNFLVTEPEIVYGLLKGSIGQASNEISGILSFTSKDDFELKMPNLSTGIVEKQYWGTITTVNNIPVVAGKSYMMTLTATGEANDIWLQRIVFYDANGTYISGKEIDKTSDTIEAPANAYYMKVSMNSPYRSIKYNIYSEYINNGNLKLDIVQIN